MASLDEIRGYLSSDKVNMRKKGKTLCDQFMQSEVTLQMIPTIELISATTAWEVREIQAYLAKNKSPERDTVFFVKNVIRYCQRFGTIKSVQMASFVKHQLDIFEIPEVSYTYKSEHVVILTDLIEQKLLHDVPFKQEEGRTTKCGFSNIFVYLKDKMTEKQYRLDRKYQNLLKALCGNMFLELPDSPSKILKPLVKWLLSMLREDATDDLASLSVCSMVSTCLTSVLSLFGISIISMLLKESIPLIPEICRHCFNRNLKEHDLNSLMGYVTCLLDHAFQQDAYLDVGLQKSLCDIYPVLESLQDFLLREDFLSSFCNFQRAKMTHRILGKDVYVNHLQDVKTCQFFRFFMLMTQYSFHRNNIFTTTNVASYAIPASVSPHTPSSPNKRQRHDNTQPNNNYNLLFSNDSQSFPIYWQKLLSLIEGRSVDNRDNKGILVMECLCFHVAHILFSIASENNDTNNNINTINNNSWFCSLTKRALLMEFIKRLLHVWCSRMQSVVHVEDKQILGAFFLAMEGLLLVYQRCKQTQSLILQVNEEEKIIIDYASLHSLQQEWLQHEQRISKLMQISCQLGSLSEVILTCFMHLLDYPSPKITALIHKAMRTWSIFQRYQEVPSILMSIVQCKCQISLENLRSGAEEETPSSFTSDVSSSVGIEQGKLMMLQQFFQGQINKFSDVATSSMIGSIFILPNTNFPHMLHVFEVLVMESLTGVSIAKLVSLLSSTYQSFGVQASQVSYPNVWYLETGAHWLQKNMFSLFGDDTINTTNLLKDNTSAAKLNVQEIRQILSFLSELIDRIGTELLGGLENAIITGDFSENAKGIATLVLTVCAFVVAITSQLSVQASVSPANRAVVTGLIKLAVDKFFCLVEKLLQYLKSKLSSTQAIDFIGSIVHRLVQLTQVLSTSLSSNNIIVSTNTSNNNNNTSCNNSSNNSTSINEGGMINRSLLERLLTHLKAVVMVCNNGSSTQQTTINQIHSRSMAMPMDDFDGNNGFDGDFADSFSPRSSQLRSSSNLAASNSLTVGSNAVISTAGTAGDRMAILRLQASSIAFIQLLVTQKPLLTDVVRNFHQDLPRLLLVRKPYGSEGKLLLAELLLKYESFSATMDLIQKNSWHTEWNSLGYTKVLLILQEVLSSNWFWQRLKEVPLPQTSRTRLLLVEEVEFYSSIMDVLFRVIVPEENDVLYMFAEESAHVRAAQLTCMANILTHFPEVEQSGWKAAAKTMFCQALQDTSLWVRLIASENCIHLLNLYARKDKVYEGVVDFFPHGLDHILSLEEDGHAVHRDIYYQDPLEIAMVVKTIANLIRHRDILRSHPQIFRMGMQDLLRIYIVLLTTDWAPVKHLQVLAGDTFAINLLVCAWSASAKSLQYRWLSDMLEEHMHWLASTWMRLCLINTVFLDSVVSNVVTTSSVSSQLKNKQDASTLEVEKLVQVLRCFPYPLFSKGDNASKHNPPSSIRNMETRDLINEEADDEVESKNKKNDDWCVFFYTQYRGIFVSVFTQLSSQQRWWALQALCTVLRLEQSDNVLHTLVRDSLVELRSYELWISALQVNLPHYRQLDHGCLGTNLDDHMVTNDQEEDNLMHVANLASGIDLFIQRMITNDHDRISCLQQQATWWVCQLLTVEIGRVVHADAQAIQQVTSLSPQLQTILTLAAEKLQVSHGVDGMLEMIDLPFVCTWLHHKMQSLKLVSSHVHILAALSVLLHEKFVKFFVLQEAAASSSIASKRNVVKEDPLANGGLEQIIIAGNSMSILMKMVCYSVTNYPDAITLVGRLLIDASKGFAMALDSKRVVSIDNLRLFMGEAVMVWNYLRYSSYNNEEDDNDIANKKDKMLLLHWQSTVEAYFGGKLVTIVDVQSLKCLESVLMRSLQAVILSWEKRYPDACFAASVLPLQEYIWPTLATQTLNIDISLDNLMNNVMASSRSVCDGHQTPAVLLFQLIQLDFLRQASVDNKSDSIENWLWQLHVTAEKAHLPLVKQLTLNMIVGDSRLIQSSTFSTTTNVNICICSNPQMSSLLAVTKRWSTTLDSIRPDDLQVALLERKLIRLVVRSLAQGQDDFLLAQQTLNHMQEHQLDILPVSMMKPSTEDITVLYPKVNILASSLYYLSSDALDRKMMLMNVLANHVHHMEALKTLTKRFGRTQYTDWICMSMTLLVDWFVSIAKPQAMTSGLSQNMSLSGQQLTRSSAISGGSNNSNSNSYKTSSVTQRFIALISSLSGMIITSVKIAETLFPLLCMHLYSQQEQFPSAWNQLQSFMIEFCLQPTRVESRVVKLACYSSFMILKKYHERFIRLKKASPAPSSSLSTKAQQLLQQVKAQMTVLYRTFPALPLSQLARVASSVGLHYTAVYFVEWAKDSDLLRGIDSSDIPNANINNKIKINVTNSNTNENANLEQNKTVFLAELYRQLDNPDAIDGLDFTQSLRVQCMLHLNRNEFLEALSTAETILATSTCDKHVASNNVTFAKQAIIVALNGLGCSHTARYMEYNQSKEITGQLKRLGDGAQEALSTWDMNPIVIDLTASKEEMTTSFNKELEVSVKYVAGQRERQLSNLLKLFPVSMLSENNNNSNTVNKMISQNNNMSSSTSAIASEAPFTNNCCNRKNVMDLCSKLSLFKDTLLQEIYHMHSEKESHASMLEEVALHQQLSEIIHITNNNYTNNIGIYTSSDSSRNAHVQSLKRQLLTQLEEHTTAEEARYITAITKLLQETHAISTPDAVEMIGHLVQEVQDERIAQAVSPLLYATWTHFSNVSSANITSSVQLTLQECMLLWTKGARQVAVSKLKSQVIDTLTEMGGINLSELAQKRPLVAAKTRRNTATNNSSIIGDSNGNNSLQTGNVIARALITAGQWLNQLGAISADRIFQEYFLPATSPSLAQDVALQVQAHKATGDFCASVFDHSWTRLQSQEWQDSQRRLQESEQELAQLNAMKTQSTENGVLNYMRMIKREIDHDKKLRATVLHTHDDMLDKLVHHYSQVLLLSPESDEDVVFRLVGYWLSHAHIRRMNETLATTLLDRVATYKLVPLQYQIFSRLGMNTNNNIHNTSNNNVDEKEDDYFQDALRLLVTRMCRDHPYHTLPQLFALAHESTVDSTAYRANMSSDRVSAAYRIVHAVRQSLPIITETMEKTLRSYIQLAKASTVELVQERAKQRLPNKGISYKEIPLQPLPSLTNSNNNNNNQRQELKYFHDLLDILPAQPILLTQLVPLSKTPMAISDHTCSYPEESAIVRIVKMETTFDITDSGISRPKIIKFLCTDGKSYRQLVKGGDDMRQDAVMQQVFATINFTLQRRVKTRKRQLHIRTYRVMPTSPQTGIIEWVENTEAFGGLINGDMTSSSANSANGGLHQRYYPGDLTHRDCRQQLDAASDKEECFALLCQQFRPSFRFFFLEEFVDPQAWYLARLRFIRSVASNSMAGYILGVGDRHAQNILIDKVTGEVVHIDFGIVFEQGKLLQIPELVPFRLTRELLDGMGTQTEVEGTFRRCCEEVLQVLRSHARQLLTILEVVIHDPLYRWSLSPIQARLKQPNNGEEAAVAVVAARQRRNNNNQNNNNNINNNMDGTAGGASRSGKDAAERTLTRIRQKLQGYEDPTGDALKVEAHVDLLINEAKNPAHLARIFVGWAPWL